MTGEYNEWIQFFCEGIAAQSIDMIQRIEDLLDVREEFMKNLRAEKARGVVLEIAEDLLGYPILTVSKAAQLHNVTYPPAKAAIERLLRLKILREMTGGDYNRIYLCPQVLDIIQRP
jgi:Fic family protein